MHRIALFVLLAACSVGEVPLGAVDAGPDAAPGPNQLSFNATIKPLVTECLPCHGAVTPPNLTSFDTLDVKYQGKPGAANIFVTKGDLTGGVHQGAPYFTPAEQTTVGNWIDTIQ
jgi:hypothetical protein